MGHRHADDATDVFRPVGGRPALSPREVVRLARGDGPAAGEDDLRRRAIVRTGAGLGERGWDDFDRARRAGYLVVARMPGRADVEPVVRLWGWWCAASRRPEAVVRLDRGGAVADLDLDLSPTGLRFEPAALATIGERLAPGGGGRWLASDETIHLTAVPTETALALVRALLRLPPSPPPRRSEAAASWPTRAPGC